MNNTSCERNFSEAKVVLSQTPLLSFPFYVNLCLMLVSVSTLAILKFECKYFRKYIHTELLCRSICFSLEETMPNSALEKLQGKQSLILIPAELGPESQKKNLYIQSY